MSLRGRKPTRLNQTPNTAATIPGLGLRGINFVVKRETAQTAS